MTDTERARSILEADLALTCVLCRGETVYQSEKKGIAPMMGFLDDGIDLCGFCAVDRVVGRAAAFLFVLSGVRALYAEVLSEGALQVLEVHGIAVSYQTLTPYIINRRGDGRCPMEIAVDGINDPNAARAAIRQTMIRLASNKENLDPNER